MRRQALTALPVAALLLGGAQCTEDDVLVLGPEILVDACAGEAETSADGVYLGGTTDCALDFGPSDISVRRDLEVRLSNVGTAELAGMVVDGMETPLHIRLSDDSDPAFRLESAPEALAEGLQLVPILISYRPNLEASQTATLLITSNAVNLAQKLSRDQVEEEQTIEIPITGTGVDNGIPDIAADPLECDFGRIAVGSVKECDLVIENAGQRALVFDGVDLHVDEVAGSAGDVFGFFGRAPAEGDVIAAAPEPNTISVALRFTPDVLGSFGGELVLHTNDPDEPTVTVTLTGVGVDPPVCDVGIKSVNGFPVEAGVAPTIEPLDDVVLTAEPSTPSTASGSIAAVRWELLERPSGSTVTFTGPNNLETGFTFAEVLGVDLAGRYRVRAVVTDDLGIESVNECAFEFEAIPTDSLLVQLTWDTSGGDMDLHLTKRNADGDFCPSGVAVGGGPASDCGSFGGEDDCYYANCKAGNNESPDWDGDGSMQTSGDPSLDIDDLSGFGPENINIDTAVPGEYLVGVDYFSGSAVAGNTIRIYLYGQLNAEFFRDLDDSDYWQVAVIHWPSACVEDLSTTVAECP